MFCNEKGESEFNLRMGNFIAVVPATRAFDGKELYMTKKIILSALALAVPLAFASVAPAEAAHMMKGHHMMKSHNSKMMMMKKKKMMMKKKKMM